MFDFGKFAFAGFGPFFRLCFFFFFQFFQRFLEEAFFFSSFFGPFGRGFDGQRYGREGFDRSRFFRPGELTAARRLLGRRVPGAAASG